MPCPHHIVQKSTRVADSLEAPQYFVAHFDGLFEGSEFQSSPNAFVLVSKKQIELHYHVTLFPSSALRRPRALANELSRESKLLDPPDR
mmetsp:Transcript_18090/g.26531  ORF Transcript_18090/g.26531 Transcript_18090/m.26531 type:complete len:89 (-) Transcript_18090:315-581(-)